MAYLSDCTEEEKNWIKGCQKHDPVAQEMLFKRFFGFALGICLRYLHDRSVSREAVNDAFLKVFELLPRESALLSFRAWMRQIVIRTAIDHFRKEKKHFYVTEEAAMEQGHTDTWFDQESVEEIMKLLETLPPLWKVVFNLYEVEGYNHEEIASMMKIPVSSSRTYLSRAKNQLRLLITSQNRTTH